LVTKGLRIEVVKVVIVIAKVLRDYRLTEGAIIDLLEPGNEGFL
jgi:hypothetical protein